MDGCILDLRIGRDQYPCKHAYIWDTGCIFSLPTYMAGALHNGGFDEFYNP